MSKMVKTIINTSPNGTKPWILDSQRQEYFTQEEINNIIIPYTEYVKNLPGALSIDVQEVDNTLVVKQEFDTQENLNNAAVAQAKDTQNSIVKLRNELYENKMKDLGLTSKIIISFE